MYYHTLNQALRAQFGYKVYKLSLDGGMTCPNRDGTCGYGGCRFCSDQGSGEFAAPAALPIAQQLEQAKLRVASKMKQGKYIAYFQNYTNTHAPAAYLKPLFSAAMAPEDVVALSIATRPDCLPEDVLNLLADLNQQKPVWVELGLQTIHPETASYIGRGYALPVFDKAVAALKAIGCQVIVHMILGLPGETEQMMYQTASYIGHSGADGIKLHLLHVLDNAALYADYAAGKFEVLTLPQYITLLEGCIRRLPREMVIHRLTGDGDKRHLVAPLWSGNKRMVLQAISRAFARDDLEQGALYTQTTL